MHGWSMANPDECIVASLHLPILMNVGRRKKMVVELIVLSFALPRDNNETNPEYQPSSDI